ncbi:MAG: PEGA domain-containing protein, partial [Nitrospinota bacterium]|nr:PEGA domain-containing protein [Nitrospinota bacterium]
MNGKSPIKPQPWAVGAAWVLIVALILSAMPGPAWAQYPQASLNAGLKAYQSGELVNAYKLLKRALVEAQTDQDRATASLYLGMLYLAWDQKKLAAESIAQAAALDPSRRLNEVEYPPEVIAMFTQARPPGLGAIAIHATPPGAMVALDGEAVVPADGAILRAAPGNHKLSFSKEGYVSQERQVTLEEYGQANIAVSLVKIVEPLAIRHLPEAFVYEGRPATISAEVTGGHLPLRAVLYFRAGPGETYQQVEMTRQKGNSYTAEASHKAKAGGLLEYYITAMDSVGGAVSAGGERRPLIIKAIPKDSVPPQISHTQAAKVSEEDTLEIHAFVTDDSPLSSVRIYFKQAGGGEYSGHEMNPWSAPGNYTFTIPGQLLEGEEIYYYLVAEDVVGNFRSLGDAAAPFVTRPTHDKPRKEAQVTQRETAAGKPGKAVTVNAGALRGYAKGDTLFAINFEEKPQNGASAAQELAGEILVTSVEPASLQGEVVREYYRGAVRPGTAVRLRPSPPRGVGAKSESFEKAQIQWRQSPEPEVRGYLVHRSDKLDGQYRVIAKLEGRGVESYLDSGEAGARLQGGMRYFYRLKSFNSSGALSDMSVTASTVILGGPKPPEGILGHSGLIRKNRLTWIPNTDPDTEGYRIYRSQAEAGAYSLIDELPDPRAGEYLDSARPEDGHPFEEGAVYWYKVLAYDKRGRVGEMSAAASASS